jgi:glycosyltransferase involved in cell wall biosynthesis
MSSLSIAHVSNTIGGGMGTVFRVLFPAQVRQGSAVVFFVRDIGPEDLAYFAAQGVEVRRVTGLTSLIRQLREFDVVHLHSADLDLLLAGWLSRRATVFTLHGLRAQTRTVSSLSLRRPPTLSGLRRRLKRYGLSLLLRHAVSRVTTVSLFLAEKAGELYGVRADTVSVVYSGMAWDPSQVPAPVRDCAGTVSGWVGRLVPVKRVDVLLRAAASIVTRGLCPTLRVIIVGDGPLMRELVALAESLGISSIVDFVGHVDNPVPYLAQMDVFVFPSQNEGAGNVLNEAMAGGLPVVVMEDGGGAVELVRRSGGGVIVSSEAALADEIAGLLRDGPRRRELAARGAAYAAKELDPSAWAASFERVYRAALSGSSVDSTG